MNKFVIVVSFGYDLLPYKWQYEKEKKNSPENNEPKWSTLKFHLQLAFYEEKETDHLYSIFIYLS